MSGGPGESTNEITTVPWSGAESYVRLAYKHAERALADTRQRRYHGRFFAAPGPIQKQIETKLLTNQKVFEDAADDVYDYVAKVRKGEFLKHTNPNLRDMIKLAIAEVKETVEEDLLPQVRDVMVASGAVGGAAQDVLERDILDDFHKRALEATMKLRYDNYAIERQEQQRFPELVGSYLQVVEAAQTLLLLRQQLKREHDQIEIDEALQTFIHHMEAEWRGVGEYAQVVFGGGFNSKSMIEPVNALASGLKGAIGGAGAGMSMFKVLGESGVLKGAAGATGAAATGTALSATAPIVGPLALLGGALGALGG